MNNEPIWDFVNQVLRESAMKNGKVHEHVEAEQPHRLDGLDDMPSQRAEPTDSRTSHQVASDEAIADLTSALLSIQQRAVATLVRTREMTFPSPERERSAEAEIRAFAQDAITAARRYDVEWFNRRQNEFTEALRRLAQPLPVVSFSENLAGHAARMCEAGWLGQEVDALVRFADGGPGGTDRVVSYDVNGATLASGRTVPRVGSATAGQQCIDAAPRWRAAGPSRVSRSESSCGRAGSRRKSGTRAAITSRCSGRMRFRLPARASSWRTP
jgi:hypothetical protein